MTKKRHGRKSASHLHNIPADRRKAVKALGGGRLMPSQRRDINAAEEKLKEMSFIGAPEYSGSEVKEAARRYCSTKYPVCIGCELTPYCYEDRMFGEPRLLTGRLDKVAEVLKRKRYLI